ncbi:alpha/beta family hydrolase [Catenovulum sediminis]|uniref:alpha/beta family hydrolase n=1 Tax=Catenovulum sediminis TaxID=1740262 RepID=UPI00117DA49D|nr:alpha/beta family hydrolase [Catenovulum sediminis]
MNEIYLILAHGAGAGSDSDFMQQVCNKITKHQQEVHALSIKVILFDFPYMQTIKESGKKRPPDRMPTLVDAYLAQIDKVPADAKLFVGGKSMGSRVALNAYLQSKRPIDGFIALGYPFHPPGKPEKHRIDLLNQCDLPGLIIQGERDTFGNRDQVGKFTVQDNYEIRWIEKADHSLKPLKSTGLDSDDTLNEASEYIKEFVIKHV